MTDKSIMPWGKYQGQALANIPDSYFLWLYEANKAHGQLRVYIEDNLAAIKKNIHQTNVNR